MILNESASSKLPTAEGSLKIFKLGAELLSLVYNEISATKISKLMVVHLKSVRISIMKSYFDWEHDISNVLDFQTPLPIFIYL